MIISAKSNKTFLFIDESGDHGLTRIDTDFPVFLLCGVLVDESEYEKIRHLINLLKERFLGQQASNFPF